MNEKKKKPTIFDNGSIASADIKIDHTTWRVHLAPVQSSIGMFGVCMSRYQEIWVFNLESIERLRDVLCHEIAHAFLEVRGLCSTSRGLRGNEPAYSEEELLRIWFLLRTVDPIADKLLVKWKKHLGESSAAN